jgi:hypothetical protein
MRDQRMRSVMPPRGSVQTNVQLKRPPHPQDCAGQAFLGMIGALS